MEFISIGELRKLKGLRIVLVAGTPSPWGQAAKAMMEYKGLDFAAARQVAGEENTELVDWTGINSGPVVAYNDEKPLDRWTDILFLLERLAPDPALIPQDAHERVRLFGMSHELAGEMGLGWNRRLMMFGPIMESGNAPGGIVRMSGKYNYNREDAKRAGARIVATLNMLHRQLEAQRQAGSDYFIGTGPSALDFYWAAFSNLIDIISWDAIPVPDDYRPLFHQGDPAIAAAFTPLLREHRDRFFDAHFKSPMEF